MAKERLKSRGVRLFVALDLPDDVRERIAAWGRGGLADPALRPVAAANLHVTLAFLGQRPEREVEEIGAAVAASFTPAPLLELDDPVGRPFRGRAKVFALPVRSDGAESLQARLVRNLSEGGLYEAESRPYWPHLTVARVRREGRGSDRPQRVELPPGKLPPDLRQGFFGVRMTLYRSELMPTGARYVPLAQIGLPDLGGG